MKTKAFILQVAIWLAWVPAIASTSLIFSPLFHSYRGREHVVTFEHYFETDFTSDGEVAALTPAQRQAYSQLNIKPVFKLLFGPSTHRSIGGPQRNEAIDVQWNQARLKEGRIILPTRYQGVWIVDREIASRGQFPLPVPVNFNKLFTPQWKRCTDSAPDHQSPTILWYYWDPSRPGCDHQAGVHYENATLKIGNATFNEVRSFPEYDRMTRSVETGKRLQVTIAFGYVQDLPNPNPERDTDPGVYEYRRFVQFARGAMPGAEEEPILQKEYEYASNPSLIIGHRFTGLLNGVQTIVNVVAAAGVDHMYLFAKSFAHDHDGVFAWMGHSRVGTGFDSDRFLSIVRSNPQYYSITKNYQLVYWGGCNSYSYYTIPFFQFKASPEDPNGTRGLDIIAHGLPSYFSLNAPNAATLLRAVLRWPSRPSYQEIIRELENNGSAAGASLLAAVLGDEDNPK
ncbi:MAG: hypothetical protein ABL958_14640 [Bdellovibrionia bacterium]